MAPMCGLIVLIGDVPATVRGQAIRGAGARGPHSWGVAGWSPDLGCWQAGHWPGRMIRLPLGPEVTVGHSRLATSTARPGDAPAAGEGQPLIDGRLLVAHNGTLTYAEQQPWTTVPDSLSLLDGLRDGVSPADRLKDTRAPQAAVWSDGEQLWCGRWGGGGVPPHPLWLAEQPDWLAVSSAYFAGATMLAAGGPVLLGRLEEREEP